MLKKCAAFKKSPATFIAGKKADSAKNFHYEWKKRYLNYCIGWYFANLLLFSKLWCIRHSWPEKVVNVENCLWKSLHDNFFFVMDLLVRFQSPLLLENWSAVAFEKFSNVVLYQHVPESWKSLIRISIVVLHANLLKSSSFSKNS